jgi:hypothetical protein
MPNETLKTVAAEIQALLEKHDLAGMIVLQAPDHLEFLKVLSPSWSVARLNEETGELRIRAKREEFPSAEEQKRCVEATIGMVLGFLGQAERDVEAFTMVAKLLGRHFEISHREEME